MMELALKRYNRLQRGGLMNGMKLVINRTMANTIYAKVETRVTSKVSRRRHETHLDAEERYYELCDVRACLYGQR